MIDSFYNEAGSQVSIVVGSGSDSIYNDRGSNVSISGGAGNDLISLVAFFSHNNLILYSAGDAKDTRRGFDWDDTLKFSVGSYSTVSVGKITLKGAASLDMLNIDGEFANPLFITLTDDNDLFSNNQESVSVDAGMGDDFIFNSGSVVLFKYAAGDGFDTILGFKANDTLKISGGSYSMQVSGNDVIVKVGKGSIVLKNVYGTADSLNINGKTIALERKVIKLGDRAVTIYSARDFFSIAGNGNDYIRNEGAEVSISGGMGNDTIKNEGLDLSIDGGAGDDTIRNDGGDRVTDSEGAGNDLIRLNSSAFRNVIYYTSGDGNDSITGFNEDDTLIIGDGTDTYS